MADEFDHDWHIRMPPKTSRPVTFVARYVGRGKPRPFRGQDGDDVMTDDPNETPAPLSDAEIAEIMGRATYVGSDVWEISEGFNGRIGSIGPIEGYDGDALGLREGSRTADFVAYAPNDIARLIATLAARDAEIAALEREVTAGQETIENLLMRNGEYREIVAAVAGDHVHQWDAVDPQEVWACEVCGEISHDWAEDVQQRARALLANSEATQTPAPGQESE